MSNIWFTSDLHFGHDREFIWKARGYESVEDMNEKQIEKITEKVQPDDDFYILGDLMLGAPAPGLECLKRLPGKIHVILGNHDTSARVEIYKELGWDVQYATVIKYKKRSFYLSHYPTLTANMDADPRSLTWNLYGHTHQTNNFFEDRPYMYHVGVDSHNGYPVHIDDILVDINNKISECLNKL